MVDVELLGGNIMNILYRLHIYVFVHIFIHKYIDVYISSTIDTIQYTLI